MSTVRLERHDEIAILRLDKERGNSIDARLVEDLGRLCHEVAQDETVRGVMLASGHPKLFCPGLDLMAMSDYDRQGLESFMGRFAHVVWALYGMRKPVLAALNGPAVAGGCVLALTADYRMLKAGARIGLSEVRLGVPLPWSIALLLRASVTPVALARVALLGKDFTGEEALAVGLAHELGPQEGFEAGCLARLREFTEKDPRALGATKAYLRSSILAEMRTGEMHFVKEFSEAWFSPATQERLKQTVASLVERAAAAPRATEPLRRSESDAAPRLAKK
jgi:Delta3-Delta2-enoyl-CoA isomerase